MAHAALRARLADGMFPSEIRGVIDDADGGRVEFIASDDLVIERTNGTGAIRVRLLERRGDRVLIEVPGDVYGAVRYIEVPVSSIGEEQ